MSEQPKENDIDSKTGEKLIYPYCGGCGHRYFKAGLVIQSKAKSGLCQWCIEEKETTRK